LARLVVLRVEQLNDISIHIVKMNSIKLTLPVGDFG
jgi:hypothetical protein